MVCSPLPRACAVCSRCVGAACHPRTSPLRFNAALAATRERARTHTHTHTHNILYAYAHIIYAHMRICPKYIYIYIYMDLTGALMWDLHLCSEISKTLNSRPADTCCVGVRVKVRVGVRVSVRVRG